MPTFAAASDLEPFDDHLLAELYDPGSLGRGRAYAREDRVRLISVGPGAIDAVCRGSAQASYLVRMRWTVRPDGVSLDDECSCPLGGGCKHCVASFLAARSEVEHDPLERHRPADRSRWRQALAGLVDSLDEEVRTLRVALQFEVEVPRAARWAPVTGPVVTMRPVREGRSSKWVKTGASWRELTSPYGSSSELPAAQRTALRTLMAVGQVSDHYGPERAIPLERFGPDLWPELRRAASAGIELVDAAGDPVELADVEARPSVDLATDEDGSVALAAAFTIDGEPVDLAGGRAGTIGTPAIGLWIESLGRLTLVPLAHQLHPAVARLMAEGGLRVPSHDVDELLDVYQPALALHAAVGSSDGSVPIAENRFEGLVLVIDRPTLDRAAARWRFRYRRGPRVVDHPTYGLMTRGRDEEAETAALDRLELPTHLLPALADSDDRPRDLTLSGQDVITFLTEVVPWLDERGAVTIEVQGDQPALREATEDPKVELTVRDGEGRDGTDWFDLDVTVTVDGEDVDFASLFAALTQDQPALILPSGTWLRLDRPELARLRGLIEEARGLAEPTAAGVARVNRFQVSWWEELVELGVVAAQSQRWADSTSRMAALAAPEPIAPPAGLRAELRTYQQEGFEWLAFLHRNGLGGILADDMGLGKTIQTLALCLHVLESRPDARFLVVAPTSVVENWAREAARFAPDLAVRTIRETEVRRGSTLTEAIGDAQLVVTSYALFRLEIEAYQEVPWELLLLDEAQFVKNRQGKTYQCARRLDAATKIAITGTPLENTLMDLWSLLSITAPGLYPDPQRFAETFRKPIESGTAPELLAVLRRRISPLLRRRTKDAVLTELPPKTEQTVEVELSPRHARIYQTQLQRQRQKVLGLVTDVQRHRFEILKSLTILRQLALDPALVDDEHEGVGSAKLDRLVDDLTQIVAEGHRALVFSQFTRFLARVRTRLDEAGIAHAYLDGRTRKRDEAIGQFKDGHVPVFVISLKAGGVGLNLTEADYCFVLDPWWNPATETQAVDRAHRMGQQNPVVVYRYVSTDTIEDKVMQLKAKKAALFDRVLDDGGALSGALSEDDIRGLLDL